MRYQNLVASAVFVMLGTVGAAAVQPDEVLSDAALEARARHISSGLRCLVCQNQSIDDSDAPLAKDLRVLVRERLKSGDSDQAAVDYIVQRYGDFVLLRPPFRASTIILWLAPFLLLFAGAAYMWRARRASVGTLPTSKALTPEEQRKLEALLKE